MIIRSTVWRDNAGLWAALAIGLGLKVILLALDVFPFNADEAVVALMARHILQGKRPVFFYGQAYLGSTDSWLTAFAFLIFGERVIAIRIAQTFLYLGTLTTAYWLGLRVFRDRWPATAAALLIAVPAVLVTLYTTATLGGYGETLLIGNILLLWALRLRGSRETTLPRRLEWLAFGALAGFGFWTFGLLGVYLAPIGAAFFFLTDDWRANLRGVLSANYLLAVFGFFIGSSPWWWATVYGAATVNELGGSAIVGSMPGGPFAAIGLRLFSLVVLGLPVVVGLRPPWTVRWLALPLAPLALVIFLGAVGWGIKMSRTHWPIRLFGGICLTVCLAFVVTPFGNDPSGRYFLPLMPPLALFTAGALSRARREYPRLALGLLLGLLSFNLWGNLDSALTFPPGITTQFDRVAQVNQRDMPAVIDFLLSHGERRGYTNYWVSFPMAFLSSEELIFTATLPYHEDFRYTPRDNRYAPYQEIVAASAHVAYITTNHPALNEYLRVQFQQMGVGYEEKAIGDFLIFYDLSRRVTPEELGIYEQAPHDSSPETP